ncbi:MAG TPA: hypothetical protein VFF11_00720, partial [Candidatus Binatia bacterium]|nr:hypothetical protein [Candidatus Binatia bacterium]
TELGADTNSVTSTATSNANSNTVVNASSSSAGTNTLTSGTGTSGQTNAVNTAKADKKSVPDVDPMLDETERILLDYISLLTKNGVLMANQ